MKKKAKLDLVVRHREVIQPRVFKPYKKYRFTEDNPNPNWESTGMTYTEYMDSLVKKEMNQRIGLDYT